ncbi:uncharacterized protein LOC119084303 [Bradysia coprophila]|uniref:uncharacterized protein LOC119084303 n=1 Tax=Bradysia coprophila TaxID=38358 RepID=UPI00187DA22B|nr:uncharacterized protein LOC119084303 [Bradysia coprophila]
MNEAAISSVNHQIKFHMTVPNIIKLNECNSPEFLVGEIPWIIKVQKRDDEDGDDPSLDIHLICVQSVDVLAWEYAAYFSYKLLSFDDNQNEDEDYSLPSVHSINNKSYVYSNFVDWDDLFDAANNYVKDGKICLEIKVHTTGVNQLNGSKITIESSKQCCENSGSATFLLKVTNINNLMAVQTPDILLQGTTWFLTVFKDHESYLGVGLDPGSSDDDTTYYIKMTSTLIDSKMRNRFAKTCDAKNFQYNDFVCSILNEKQVSWVELFKPQNGFITNNSVMLQVDIKMSKADESESAAMYQAPNPQLIGCAICLETFGDQDVSCPPCGHLFCADCIKTAALSRNSCPTCNGSVTLSNLRRVFLSTVN